MDGDDCRGLVCSSLTDTGTYYAAKTLQQLLAPTLKGKGPEATAGLPVVKVVDWPDLAERGEWGGSAVPDLEWMAAGKLNLIELHATLSLDEAGVGHGLGHLTLVVGSGHRAALAGWRTGVRRDRRRWLGRWARGRPRRQRRRAGGWWRR